MVPGTLEALSEAISEHPTLSMIKDGTLHRVDTSHVAFFLVSDIGWVVLVCVCVPVVYSGLDGRALGGWFWDVYVLCVWCIAGWMVGCLGGLLGGVCCGGLDGTVTSVFERRGE